MITTGLDSLKASVGTVIEPNSVWSKLVSIVAFDNNILLVINNELILLFSSLVAREKFEIAVGNIFFPFLFFCGFNTSSLSSASGYKSLKCSRA